MKKILFILSFMLMSVIGFSQVNFMGIPVDGDARNMLNQLRAKGFVDMSTTYEMENMTLPILKGTFNGMSAYIFISTNNKKVYRVYVAYAKTVSEAQIIIHYNNLLYQFENNKKYLHIDGQEIQQSENVSYEMLVHNKVYDASFYQILSDEMTEKNLVWYRICEYGSEYYISIFYDNLSNKANGEDL